MAAEQEITAIESPSELEVGITGPKNADRLFVYAGLARLGFSGDDDNHLLNFPIRINLSRVHSGRKFDPIVTLTAPVAFLGDIHGNLPALEKSVAEARREGYDRILHSGGGLGGYTGGLDKKRLLLGVEGYSAFRQP